MLTIFEKKDKDGNAINYNVRPKFRLLKKPKLKLDVDSDETPAEDSARSFTGKVQNLKSNSKTRPPMSLQKLGVIMENE